MDIKMKVELCKDRENHIARNEAHHLTEYEESSKLIPLMLKIEIIEGVSIEYDKLSDKYKILLEEKSMEICESFMRSEGIDKLLIVGGSILKNKLRKPIDDYDVKIIGNRENLIALGNSLVYDKKWKSIYDEKIFIEGTSSLNSIYCCLQSPSPENLIFDIGFREEENQKQLTPFVLESLVVKLVKDKMSEKIKRIILDIEPLKELEKSKLTIMESKEPFELYRIIQRFFVTTIKYDINDDEKQKVVNYILDLSRKVPKMTEPTNSKINSIRKLFMLLNRVDNKIAEEYLKYLNTTSLMKNFFSDLNIIVDKNKNQLIKDLSSESNYQVIKSLVFNNITIDKKVQSEKIIPLSFN